MNQYETDIIVDLVQQSDPATVARLLGGNSTASSSPNEFDPVVFWSVNAIWMTAVAVLIIFFWKCQGAERLQRWMSTGRESDRIYARSIHRRREARRQAKQMSPTQRRNFLERSFQRNKVHMIVEEGDIIKEESLAGSQKGNLDSSTKGEPVSDNLEFSHNEETQESIGGSCGGGFGSNKGDAEAGLKNDNQGEGDANISDVVDDYSQGVDVETGVTFGEATGPPSTGFDTGMLRLRGENVEPGRKVPNCCAVCLGPYEVGDAVVWSSNPCCSHAFHEECLVDWLIKMQEGTPCPCCRSDFLPDVEKDIQEMKRERRIRWGAQNAMNINAVRL